MEFNFINIPIVTLVYYRILPRLQDLIDEYNEKYYQESKLEPTYVHVENELPSEVIQRIKTQFSNYFEFSCETRFHNYNPDIHNTIILHAKDSLCLLNLFSLMTNENYKVNNVVAVIDISIEDFNNRYNNSNSNIRMVDIKSLI